MFHKNLINYCRVEASKPLGRVEMLQMAYVTENTRVYLLVPLVVSDKEAAVDFMTKYSETCTQSELTFLMLVSDIRYLFFTFAFYATIIIQAISFSFFKII